MNMQWNIFIDQNEHGWRTIFEPVQVYENYKYWIEVALPYEYAHFVMYVGRLSIMHKLSSYV